MNEGENSGIPNSPNFSSPNISSNNGVNAETQAIPTQQAITSSDISAMAGTGAGSVAAAAAAMPENDMPTAISSGPSLSASNSNSERSRFNFGSRRFRDAKSSQPSTPMFAGAPDYFNQAAGDIELSGYETEKKNKKPFIIGGIVLAIIAVVVCVVLVIPKNGSSDSKITNLQQLMTDYSDNVAFFENSIKLAVAGGFELSANAFTEKQYNAEKDKSTSNLARVKELRQKLNNYSGIKMVDDGTNKNIQEQIDKLKKLLDSRMAIYEKYATIIPALYHVYSSEAGDAAINELKAAYDNENINEVARVAKNYYTKHKEYRNQHYTSGCNEHPNTSSCIAIVDSILSLQNSYTNNKALNSAMLSLVDEEAKKEDPLTYMSLIENAKERKDKKDEK